MQDPQLPAILFSFLKTKGSSHRLIVSEFQLWTLWQAERVVLKKLKAFARSSGNSLEFFKKLLINLPLSCAHRQRAEIQQREETLRNRNSKDKQKCQGWFKSRHCHSVRQKFKKGNKHIIKSGGNAKEIFRRWCGFP